MKRFNIVMLHTHVKTNMNSHIRTSVEMRTVFPQDLSAASLTSTMSQTTKFASYSRANIGSYEDLLTTVNKRTLV